MSLTLSEMQKSALQEAGSIGSGHAAIALSQLMGKKIMIAIPLVEVLPISEFSSFFGGAGSERVFIQVGMRVLGDARGAIAFIIEEKMALRLCDLLMGQAKGAINLISESEQSAIKETGSIMCSSYLNAMSEITGISILVSIPNIFVGSMDAMGELMKKKYFAEIDTDLILCIKTEFLASSERIDGFIVFAPSADVVDKMLKGLGT